MKNILKSPVIVHANQMLKDGLGAWAEDRQLLDQRA